VLLVLGARAGALTEARHAGTGAALLHHIRNNDGTDAGAICVDNRTEVDNGTGRR
jgi:hypothetical protein